MGMQLKLHMITIEDLVPEGHFLRKSEATLDLSFIHEETAHLYNRRYGRPPIEPVVLVKYLLVGYLYGIPSERQIEQRIRTTAPSLSCAAASLLSARFSAGCLRKWYVSASRKVWPADGWQPPIPPIPPM